jgi:hypothetical protein
MCTHAQSNRESNHTILMYINRTTSILLLLYYIIKARVDQDFLGFFLVLIVKYISFQKIQKYEINFNLGVSSELWNRSYMCILIEII